MSSFLFISNRSSWYLSCNNRLIILLIRLTMDEWLQTCQQKTGNHNWRPNIILITPQPKWGGSDWNTFDNPIALLFQGDRNATSVWDAKGRFVLSGGFDYSEGRLNTVLCRRWTVTSSWAANSLTSLRSGWASSPTQIVVINLQVEFLRLSVAKGVLRGWQITKQILPSSFHFRNGFYRYQLSISIINECHLSTSYASSICFFSW